MWNRLIRRLPGLVFVSGAVACSLVVDTSEVDSGCGPGRKFCDGDCVGVSDAAYGCTPDKCEPCEKDQFGEPFGDRVIPKCGNGVCVVGSCAYGYGCDGCKERLLTDPSHCGTCGNQCDLEQTCSFGRCVDPGNAGGAGGGTGGAGGESSTE